MPTQDRPHGEDIADQRARLAEEKEALDAAHARGELTDGEHVKAVRQNAFTASQLTEQNRTNRERAREQKTDAQRDRNFFMD